MYKYIFIVCVYICRNIYTQFNYSKLYYTSFEICKTKNNYRYQLACSLQTTELRSRDGKKLAPNFTAYSWPWAPDLQSCHSILTTSYSVIFHLFQTIIPAYPGCLKFCLRDFHRLLKKCAFFKALKCSFQIHCIGVVQACMSG